MSILKQVKELYNKSYLARSENEVEAYRSILAAALEKETSENVNLTDEEVLIIIDKEVKAQKIISDLYKTEEAQRIDDAKDWVIKADIRAEILSKLLPVKIGLSDYPAIVDEAISFTEAKSIRDMKNVVLRIKRKYGLTVNSEEISKEIKKKLLSFSL